MLHLPDADIRLMFVREYLQHETSVVVSVLSEYSAYSYISFHFQPLPPSSPEDQSVNFENMQNENVPKKSRTTIQEDTPFA